MPNKSIDIRAQRQARISPIPDARPQIAGGKTKKVASCTKCPISPIGPFRTCSKARKARSMVSPLMPITCCPILLIFLEQSV